MSRGVAPSTAVSHREELTARLFARLRESDESSREPVIAELVTVNLPLADALASRYFGRGVEREDLIQVARTALLLAIRRFRPSEGIPFGAFAVPTITGELKRHFRDHCWVVRPPRQIQELRARVVSTREQVEQHSGSQVSARELAERLSVDQSRVAECLTASASFRPVSLDANSADDEGPSMASTLSCDEDLAERLVEHHDLRLALAQLSPRERQVLEWRFQEECSQREIGERLGVSQMQVSRIIRGVLARVRVILSPAEPLAG
ncbi:RNA polymerase sigma-B factor [Propionibacterium cyclohexanicum]|uniref:RNA polymerase sigma-B factor n=1 Tax=Propionibacterium cyclohexanicum TaxID=64702 RepID=A0A1H9SGP9_9ACTN|nr:sigma-70 family RNA polymerase sigma factor [Propionibacterium cyclohexanicum]SER84131.1 RNA polymerase sigma-B factor [Propionibacterium cyclohexanicum]